MNAGGGLAVTDVLFRFDVDASPQAALEAVKTTEGAEAGRVAYTWGQVVVALKHYAETGRPDPVFT
jgi:hypothetical protein